MDTILVVDDEEDIHYSFRRNFNTIGWNLLFASSGEEGLKSIAKNPPSVVVMDVRMAGLSGLETLKKIRETLSHLPVIIMTAHGTTQTAIEAMKYGAYDYLSKPFDVERMQQVILSALKASRDMREKVSYQPLLQKEEYDEGIIGKTPPMQDVYKIIGQVSESDVPVIITGETGTGKELVARAIVQHSKRANKPFLAINCAAIPENLLESELFGYEKGAFTGATDRRIGKFEQCDTGTIFLDELAELPIATQAKLLRVLQGGEFSRLGSNQTIKINVRVIAATNQNLEKKVQEKTFREDLYYRLSVVRIQLPPLRDRLADLPLLIEYFLQRLQKQEGAKQKHISKEALEKLKTYDWPGNVRQLQNIIERAFVICNSETIGTKHIAIEESKESKKEIFKQAPELAPSSSTLEQALEIIFREAEENPKLQLLPHIERELVKYALAKTQGNHVRAAKLLGITRATLRKRVEKFGIKRELNIS